MPASDSLLVSTIDMDPIIDWGEEEASDIGSGLS